MTGAEAQSSPLTVAPFWPARVWFEDLMSLLDGIPGKILIWRDLSQVQGMIFQPQPEIWKIWVWRLRDRFWSLAEDNETILSSRATSTR